MTVDDGSQLLTSPKVGPLLQAAVAHQGGNLVEWRLEQIDAKPGRSTTATYAATVDWKFGSRQEVLGVSARTGELVASDANAEIFADGNRQVAVWLYPHDPDLPGLARVALPDGLVEVLAEAGVLSRFANPKDLRVKMISYRPRNRAVARVEAADQALYIKVLRKQVIEGVVSRHQLLRDAGLPVPEILAATADHLLVTKQLPGKSLAKELFASSSPCTAEQLVTLLDLLPKSITKLNRRPPWAEAVEHYAQLVARSVPATEADLSWSVTQIRDGLAGIAPGKEATHGDFHESQLRVAQGHIVGLLDVDTAGPGRRADDLACLVAHLAAIQGMDADQDARLRQVLSRWVPVFDERVDPVELRLRAAAVVISLATGPYRGQEKTGKPPQKRWCVVPSH